MSGAAAPSCSQPRCRKAAKDNSSVFPAKAELLIYGEAPSPGGVSGRICHNCCPAAAKKSIQFLVNSPKGPSGDAASKEDGCNNKPARRELFLTALPVVTAGFCFSLGVTASSTCPLTGARVKVTLPCSTGTSACSGSSRFCSAPYKSPAPDTVTVCASLPRFKATSSTSSGAAWPN